LIALAVTLWAIEKPSGNSSATNLASAVSIKASWPLSPGCDGSTSVAVFPDGPSPEAVLWPRVPVPDVHSDR
jgi:hypothetical protein